MEISCRTVQYVLTSACRSHPVEREIMRKFHQLIIIPLLLMSSVIYPNFNPCVAKEVAQSLNRQAIEGAMKPCHFVWTECGDSSVMRYGSSCNDPYQDDSSSLLLPESALETPLKTVGG